MIFRDTRPQPAASGEGRRRGVVVTCSAKPLSRHGHEWLTHNEVARRLAAVKDYDFAGEFDPDCHYGAPLYFVPCETLLSAEAETLGIRCEHDLFGGVVPFPFVASKTITHGLPSADAYAPAGWSQPFAEAVHADVLPGFSAFTREDAHAAAASLINYGKVRIKIASGAGGLGQSVIADAQELDAFLSNIETQALQRDGLVLEVNLAEVITYSVGQVRVGDLSMTYCGIQKLATSNHGEEVYGGSDLTAVRGDFDALLRLSLEEHLRGAIAQARTYHAAALSCYPGMFMSRANYDIARGRDDTGRWHSGVLEQSWRIGGASPAELAALEVFRANPAVQVVCASVTEVYGNDPVLPQGAVIYYQGSDEHAGRLTKYSMVKPYDNT